ncbi:hypothetical protein [Ferruginibacter sp.]|uniref:hypothetical protein n=1 Tax=Ferruginibacter sp. TaxID=1940288 RepID=UPI00374D9550
MHNQFDNTTKAGTVSGTLLTIFVNLQYEDILKTVLLAGIGAFVSFFVSVGLKYLLITMKNHRRRKW